MKVSEIKKEAREALTGKSGKGICIVLAYLAISFIMTFIRNLFEEGSNLYLALDIVYLIISVPLSFGLLISFIKLKRNEEIKCFDFIKEGFSRYSKSWIIILFILLKLLLPILCIIISIILLVISAIYSIIYLQNYLLFIAGIILFILAIIYTVSRYLLYVLAYNISYDNPELSSKECVKMSEKLMKGNRKKYLLLILSFIGWFILTLLTFGIALLWLMPYLQVTSICFYEKISEKQNSNI